MKTEDIEAQLDILFDLQRIQDKKWKTLVNILGKEFVTINDLKAMREQLPYKKEEYTIT